MKIAIFGNCEVVKKSYLELLKSGWEDDFEWNIGVDFFDFSCISIIDFKKLRFDSVDNDFDGKIEITVHNYEKVLNVFLEYRNAKSISLDFLNWLKKNDIPKNAAKYFHYSDEDMFNAFTEERIKKLYKH